VLRLDVFGRVSAFQPALGTHAHTYDDRLVACVLGFVGSCEVDRKGGNARQVTCDGEVSMRTLKHVGLCLAEPPSCSICIPLFQRRGRYLIPISGYHGADCADIKEDRSISG
jgi:hypothetical protein